MLQKFLSLTTLLRSACFATPFPRKPRFHFTPVLHKRNIFLSLILAAVALLTAPVLSQTVAGSLAVKAPEQSAASTPAPKSTQQKSPAKTTKTPQPTGKNAAIPAKSKTDSSAKKSPTKTPAKDSTRISETAAVSKSVSDSTLPGEKTGSIADVIKQTAPKQKWSITVSKILWSLVVLLLAVFIIRSLTNLLERIAERWPNLRLTIKRLIPAIRILSWTFVIYEIIAVILAPPWETIITLSAAAGLGVGLASQDILRNIFGGIMILLDRPFQVGDKISAGGHYGEVVQIGLRTVRIVTPDDNLVSIPNGDVMNQPVSNANAGEPNCQVVAEFFLPPDININRTKEIAYLAAATSRYVFLNKPIVVILKNEIYQGRSLLKMRLKAYVLDIRYEFPFMSEMTETVIRELLDSGLVKPDELEGFPPKTA